MDASLQLFSFFVSLCFGFVFHFLANWHFQVTDTYSLFVKYLSTFMFMVDVILAYVLIMYHINDGIIHIYFLSFVFIGFFLYGILQKHVKLRNILSPLLSKFKR